MNIALRNGLAQELVERAILAIEAQEPHLHAWSYFDADRARRRARDVDIGFSDGPLYGILVGIKDIFDTDDMVTSYGSEIHSAHRPARDAALVAQLRRSGAVIMGKTATTEFASPHPTRTRNPRNTRHSPGGSSSGSAAAVASGMVPLALGSQTLGSIVRPASYCGVYGFKPSHGRISRVGVLSLSDTLDTIGALGSSLPVLEKFYRHVTGDSSAAFDGRKPRVATCEAPGWEHTSKGARDAFDREVERLQQRGVNPRKIVLPQSFLRLPGAGQTIHDYELYANFASERLGHWDQLSDKFQAIMRRGKGVGIGQYEDALGLAGWCRDEFARLMTEFDVLATLSATDEAPEGLESTGSPAVNIAWTLLRGPCVSLPKMLGPKGLPIGLQLCSPQFTDHSLLASANWLDRM
jgi:Asp-tRNA(Asn)/Glu-tRNA(Gln) amidotransferase A subunit family amidase